MAELRLTQAAVAEACGVTQPHLSKVLSGKVDPGHKTERALKAWLSKDAAVLGGDYFERLTRKLRAATPRKRMQIMQILEALEVLIED